METEYRECPRCDVDAAGGGDLLTVPSSQPPAWYATPRPDEVLHVETVDWISGNHAAPASRRNGIKRGRSIGTAQDSFTKVFLRERKHGHVFLEGPAPRRDV